MSIEGLYDIRPANSQDYNFILATWLRGLYYGDSWFSSIPKHLFMDNYKRLANATLTNPKIKIQVACLKEDPNVILGYSIVSADDKAVVWLFVKTAWREQGIGRSLLPHSPQYVTLLTGLGKTLLPKLSGCVFNPFY